MSTTLAIRRLKTTHLRDAMPYAIFFVLMLCLHLQFKLGFGDDPMNKALLQGMDFWDAVVYEYPTWSSRQLLNVGMYLMIQLPELVWRVCNPAVLTLIAWCMARLLQLEKDWRRGSVLCGVLLCYAWENLSSAGWISTTLVFVWPLAAALVALQPYVIAFYEGKSAPLWLQVLSGILVTYACNMEQIGLFFLLALPCVFMSAKLCHFAVPKLLFVHFSLCIASLLYIATCPGVALRTGGETASYFPDFGARSVLQNLELGFSSGFAAVVYEADALFFVFTAMLLLCVWARYESFIYRAIACVPFVCSAVLGVLYAPLQARLAPLSFFRNALTSTGMITVEYAGTPKRYLSFLLLCAVFVCCLAGLLLALGARVQAYVAVCLFCVGFATRGALGFSPTVWMSGNRTGFFFAMTIVVCAMLLYGAMPKAATRSRFVVMFFIVVCALCEVVSLVQL